MNNFSVRNASRIELNTILGWAALEGWNPGLYDADCFYQTDPKGFFIGLLNNQPISSVSLVSYDKSFAFLGLYIVKPEYRGNGYGLKTWHKALEFCQSQNIGLDGVVKQQENYQKSGFKFAYRNIRFQGKSHKNLSEFPGIIPLPMISFEEILTYDKFLFPSPRPQFLKNWISLPESHALGYKDQGKLKGYGIIRKCRTGYKIGPLLAENEEIAEKLFHSLTGKIENGTDFFLDIPQVNPAAIKLAEKYQLKPVFETARMYTKETPKLPMSKIFGVTTLELG